jgi:hypothetical protein
MVARFFDEIYQKVVEYTTLPINYTMAYIPNIPNSCNIFQMALEYTNLFHSKVLKTSPKLGFWV